MRKYFLCSFVCTLLLLSSGCNDSSSGSAGGGKAPGSVTEPGSNPSGNPGPAAGDIKVSASSNDGYAAENTLDGSLDPESRWSASGDDEWIEFDLGDEYQVKGLDIAFYQSESRVQKFSIVVKTDAGKWIKIFTGANRKDGKPQHFGFYPRTTRYVRIAGNGGGDRGMALVEVTPVYDDETKFPKGKYEVTYHVAPNGNDRNDGKSEDAPLRSIQDALELAQPGDRILLAAGRYMQDVRSVRSGTSESPITIEGSENAIIQGTGNEARVFEINHDHMRLLGFTMDGKVNDGKREQDYRDKLMYVQGTASHRGPNGLMIRGMTFLNAGGECLRLRYFIRNADVGYNHFENCGVHDFKFGGAKNGEAIYLGTSSTQWGDGKNPTSDADISSENRIHHNTFNTQGNECVDIKEGSVNNVVEYNYCTGQRDSSSGGFDTRSDKNTFRFNVAIANSGAGVRIGGHEVDGHLYGAGNNVYGNLFQDNGAGTIKFMVEGQGHVCENTIAGTKGLLPSGEYSEDPAQGCRF